MPIDNSTPQFTTTEYKGAAAGDRCKACGQPIAGQFYRVNGQPACGSCTDRLKRESPQDNHARFVRGIVFGAVSAVIAMGLHATFTIATGFYIGYVALAVGWLIAKAILMGSGGVGGRRYQILAVLLTYAAVSIAAIPIALFGRNAHATKAPQSQQSAANKSTDEAGSATPAPAEQQNRPSLAAAIGQLLLIGLASPFIELQDPAHGLIGLVILFVGLRIAWRLAQGRPALSVAGPYSSSNAAKA